MLYNIAKIWKPRALYVFFCFLFFFLQCPCGCLYFPEEICWLSIGKPALLPRPEHCCQCWGRSALGLLHSLSSQPRCQHLWGGTCFLSQGCGLLPLLLPLYCYPSPDHSLRTHRDLLSLSSVWLGQLLTAYVRQCLLQLQTTLACAPSWAESFCLCAHSVILLDFT